MLSDQFREEIARRAARKQSTHQQRAQRDAFIQTQWPLMDKAFADLVDATVGTEAHLSMTHTPATDNFTNHSFVTLDKTITAVRSTLNLSPETVTFTPFLETIEPDQFGVIRIQGDGLPYSILADRGAAVFAGMLKRGILMRGKTQSSLVVPDGANFLDLNAELLEGFLSALFLRG
jgi:hypothetical protein